MTVENRAPEPLLRIEDLSVRFGTEDGVVSAVRGLRLEVFEREVLGVVGESGSGKSVTGLAVMGLLPPRAEVTGRILLKGEDVTTMTKARLRSVRGRKVAMVFQDPMTALNPVHTIGDQLAEAVRSHQAVSSKSALEQAAEMLDLVGIPRPRERLRNYPHEFSGGMRQRVMIAMAVINKPDLIIADEPTTALDVTVQAQILEKLLEVKDAVGAAIVLITHDLGVVAGMAGRVLVMYAGRAVEYGRTEQVFRTPRMPYTAGLLGSIPGLDASAHRLRPIPGAPPSLINLPPGCPFYPRCPIARDRCATEEPLLADAGHAGHTAACHFRGELSGLSDPTTIFRAEEVDAE
ncbi:MAG: glutathione transport system ATP-binding protein [Actinomycetota bacterium]|nr:glutathione transport system ATP-binding protein [Actinomycetota bacterium]